MAKECSWPIRDSRGLRLRHSASPTAAAQVDWNGPVQEGGEKTFDQIQGAGEGAKRGSIAQFCPKRGDF